MVSFLCIAFSNLKSEGDVAVEDEEEEHKHAVMTLCMKLNSPGNHDKAAHGGKRAKDLADLVAEEHEAENGAREGYCQYQCACTLSLLSCLVLPRLARLTQGTTNNQSRRSAVPPRTEGDSRVRAQRKERNPVVDHVRRAGHPTVDRLVRHVGVL